MGYTEMRNAILFRYHKDINYWWRLLGEMFEGTDGFTEGKTYTIRCVLDGKKVSITWDAYSWYINGGFD